MDLISRKALVEKLRDNAKSYAEMAEKAWGQFGDYFSGIKTGFSSSAILANVMPTIDAVPVVRCKDCKWWIERHPRLGVPWCRQMHLDRGADGYCEMGERREDAMMIQD